MGENVIAAAWKVSASLPDGFLGTLAPGRARVKTSVEALRQPWHQSGLDLYDLEQPYREAIEKRIEALR
jgi:hypothetical protein